MSQHHVRLECKKAGGPVCVQLGWDKPMAEFYLVVFTDPGDDKSKDEELVYSNLNDPRAAGQGLDYFKMIAKDLGCELPDSMWAAAYQDREFNVVNKVVFYSPAGNVIEPE
ncbi:MULTISPECIES: hypothetical protein [Stutzerimonas]|uniref:hypothetical protein n=1 Tax=Stutzerimonas TaxID=2901164 RepID=UPI00190AC033|nr:MULTISPECIES: hypothetical protein [Stutzerimonas]MBK3919990.1 hypothetical protein [Stutzerimonas frequens]